MNINDVNQTINVAQTSQRQLATSNSKDGKELGKQDFLNLLMTQMSHQDPMDPMNTDSMMQQMASLGTVEQLQNLNAKTDSLLNYQEQLMRSGSAGFLGKDVEVQANEIQLMNGASAPISYELVGDADEVVLQIMNDVGDVVRQIPQEARSQGHHNVLWDGMDNEGDPLSDGTYSVNVVARTQEGAIVDTLLSKSGQVQDIRFEGGGAQIKVNNEWISTGDIQGLGDKTDRRFAQAQPMPLHTELQLRQAYGRLKDQE
ncbi:MAG: flagellar hook assembly protein FlgD [Deltaproteobacteria bacterium]